MRKFLFLMFATAIFCSSANAENGCGMGHKMSGGFYDIEAKPMSVAEVKKQPEDTFVGMQGYITKRLGKDTYNFSDGTDNLVVEIKAKKWHGQIVSPKDKVMLWGEVDDEDGVIMVDVKSVSLMK